MIKIAANASMLSGVWLAGLTTIVQPAARAGPIFQIVAVFVTDTEFDYVRPEFETKKERTEYLETVARKNLFAIDGAAIEDGDKLLTLSMCCTLYGKNETGDQRLVVAAKLLPTAAEEAPYAVQDAKFPELPENK